MQAEHFRNVAHDVSFHFCDDMEPRNDLPDTSGQSHKTNIARQKSCQTHWPSETA
jgi:hypothetical protein